MISTAHVTSLGERYDVLREIGRGGMGVVFEVRDKRTERKLAAKVLSPLAFADDDWRSRFDLESTVTSDVRSPHVLPVLDAGVDAATGLAFLVTELLNGEDLGSVLRGRGPFSWETAMAVLQQVARGLDSIHAAGVVHRDLKPENLFLAESEEGPVVKILDFGVAKVVALSRTSLRSTRTLGSPLYMSPEQLEGEATLDGRSDIYAFGHLAFTLLVGEAYWEETWRAARGVYPVLLRMMKGARVPPSARANALDVTLPDHFDVWFARATARKPADRFDTTAEAFAALRSGMPPARRTSVITAACAALGVLAIVVAVTRDGSDAKADNAIVRHPLLPKATAPSPRPVIPALTHAAASTAAAPTASSPPLRSESRGRPPSNRRPTVHPGEPARTPDPSDTR